MFEHSIRIKDYNCFREELQGFEKLLPINIIIGKNNGGKSSLIDIIENICARNSGFGNIFSEVKFSKSYFEWILRNYSESLLFNRSQFDEFYESTIGKSIFLPTRIQ